MSKPTFDVAAAFRLLQKDLLNSHEAIRAVTGHPTTVGDQSEKDWIGVLQGFLPERYSVGPIFAIDAYGDQSEQIDVAVYDRQYSPMWFGTNGSSRFVPVESVYAVFEVKPELSAEYVEAARRKVNSVRVLHRTSAPIKHAGGVFKEVDADDKHLIGGLLTAKSSWANRENTISKLTEHLPVAGTTDALDIGIAAGDIAFDHTPVPAQLGTPRASAPLEFSPPGDQLIHFGIRLFRQLQQLGTVLAIDMSAYEGALSERR